MASSALSRWLSTRSQGVLTAYTVLPAFFSYMCMYAYRKPFTALQWADHPPITLGAAVFDFKTLAVVAQLCGYAMSKVAATKFASEAAYEARVPNVLCLLAFAQLALLCFALVPAPLNIVFLFFNGLPLGMVWSMLFGLLEGRRITEFIALAMASSQIFASGWTKAAGLVVRHVTGCADVWMPALTGFIFAPLLLISLTLLRQLPPPSDADRAERAPRKPMSGSERLAFLRTYGVGVAPLCVLIAACELFRDLRDSFMPDILRDFGEEADASTFASVDITAGLVAILALVSLGAVRDTAASIVCQCVCVACGGVTCGVAGLLAHNHAISAAPFLVATGVGLYLIYTTMQSLLMDRLLALLQTPATASFLAALSDSCGYTATVILYLSRALLQVLGGTAPSYTGLLILFSAALLLLAPLCMGCVLAYFGKYIWRGAGERGGKQQDAADVLRGRSELGEALLATSAGQTSHGRAQPV